MPGAVPHASTYALEIANRGWRDSARDPALAGGVNVVDGRVTHPAVAEARGLDYTALERS